MKISDYVIDYIADLGVDKVFCVTGGGAMHLNNSLGSSKKMSGVFMLHEQGASIAAESYARVNEGYGCCLVTSGPGATNAITGLVGAYIDSIPVIFISGQAKRADLVGDQKIRQFGIQEVNIISMVSSYSKYAVQIKNPEDIRYELEKASFIAMDGRPGPVWIDIPLDVQNEEIDIDSLEGFDSAKEIDNPEFAGQYGKDIKVASTSTASNLTEAAKTAVEMLKVAKRPLILVGQGLSFVF